MKFRTLSVIFVLAASVIVAFTLAQTAEELNAPPENVFPKGDEKKGRLVFEVKNCHRCHTVKGEKFPEIDLPAIDNITLCGENNAQWTRDEYAHHIMSPEHLISPDHQKAMLIIGDKLGAENSPMPSFIDALTVRDLINIATYLEAQSDR